MAQFMYVYIHTISHIQIYICITQFMYIYDIHIYATDRGLVSLLLVFMLGLVSLLLVFMCIYNIHIYATDGVARNKILVPAHIRGLHFPPGVKFALLPSLHA